MEKLPESLVALARLAASPNARRAQVRRAERIWADLRRRMIRSGGFAAALILALLLWGLIIGPIGTTTLVLTTLLGAIIMFALLFWPASKAPARLKAADPRTLPAHAELWLDTQRKALPAPAKTQLDTISDQLATLQAQLDAAPPPAETARDLDRLLKNHLPELVERYTRVPTTQRSAEIETSLTDGLNIVQKELSRTSESLSETDRDGVLIQRRFLESRNSKS